MHKPSVFGFVLFFLVGTLLYVGGVFSLTRAFILSRSGARAQGMVIEDVQKTQTDKYGNPYVLHYPRVQFVAQDRAAYSFVSDMGSGSPGYRIGQRVPVVYDSAHPAAAHIDDFMNTWFAPLVLIGLSLLPLAVMTAWIKGFLTDSSLGI